LAAAIIVGANVIAARIFSRYPISAPQAPSSLGILSSGMFLIRPLCEGRPLAYRVGRVVVNGAEVVSAPADFHPLAREMTRANSWVWRWFSPSAG
jgi:hypothetical protein